MPLFRLTPPDRIAVIAVGVSVFSVFFSLFQYRQQTNENLSRERQDSIRFNQQISDQRLQFEKQMSTAEEHFLKQFELSKKNDSAQLRLTAQSIKNFVRPLLVIRRRIDKEDEDLGLFIQNSGIGPAVITSIELFYNGKRLKSAAEISPMVLADKLGFWAGYDAMPSDPPSFSDFKLYDVIQKGEELKIYHLNKSRLYCFDIVCSTTRLQTVLNDKIKIIVHYHSLTEDSFIVRD